MLDMEILRNSKLAVSADTDNATATAAAAAQVGVTMRGLGVFADYSAAVAAIKTIVIKKGTTAVLTMRWDFALGPCYLAFPGLVQGDSGGALSAELAASGSGGITGRVTLFYSET